MKPTPTLAACVVLALLLLAACAAQAPLPQPRSVIVYSGERLQTDGERMREVEQWLQPQLEVIETDPSLVIRWENLDRPAYPWDTLEIEGDTVTIGIERAAVDARTPHMIYAHLRMVAERGELHDWLPDLDEGEEVPAFELEERILQRVSDVWLLGRAVFDTHAYGPLDELLYANERGRLRDFILATQGDRFAEARDRHAEENPGWEAELQAFFRRTFERDGPGYLPADRAGEEPAASGGGEIRSG
jgi:hypothetical protein